MLIYFDSFIADLIGPCKILFTNFFQGWREVSFTEWLGDVLCYNWCYLIWPGKSSSILLYAASGSRIIYTLDMRLNFGQVKWLNSNLQLMLTWGYETMLQCSKPVLYLQVPVSHHCVYRHIYFKIDGTNRYLQRHSLFSSRGERKFYKDRGIPYLDPKGTIHSHIRCNNWILMFKVNSLF